MLKIILVMFFNMVCFACSLTLGIKDIALNKRKLRDKIVNSVAWTFLTYMPYHNMENRIPRNENIVEISQ